MFQRIEREASYEMADFRIRPKYELTKKYNYCALKEPQQCGGRENNK